MSVAALRCASCAADLTDTLGFVRCQQCEAPMHEGCRDRAGAVCPRCGGPVGREAYVVPVTPGLDSAVVVTGGAAVLVVVVAACLIWLIPMGRDAPGLAGFAFFFVAGPVIVLALVLGGAWLVLLRRRRRARQPVRTGEEER